MSQPPIIGLHGQLQSGKDTLTRALTEIPGRFFVLQIAFADPLKQSMMHLFGGGEVDYWGTNADKDAPFEFWNHILGEGWQTNRQAMQTFGDVVRDNIHPRILIHRARRRILDAWKLYGAAERKPLFVISDVRAGLGPDLTIEADTVREWGGRVYRVTRADGVRAATTGIVGHRTEAAIPESSMDETLVIEKGGHAAVASRLYDIATAGL